MAFPLPMVGLTGGIACGKSAVAAQWRDMGIPVVDADDLGRLVLQPDMPAYAQVLEAFGSDIATPGGAIDRKKLGAVVFADDQARRKLESIVHPAIAAMAKQAVELICDRGAPFAVYEAALLVETGMYRAMDALVVVTAPLEQQLKRVCARDGLSPKEAAARIAAQLPAVEKEQVADYVLRNDGDLASLRAAARELGRALQQRFGKGEHA